MRRLPQLSLFSICILGMTACATTQTHRPRPPRAEKQVEKAGQKQVPAAPIAEPPSPAVDLAGLSVRIQNMQQPLSDADIRDATQLYPTRPGTQEEAIFVLVQLRLLEKDLQAKTGFQSADLYNREAPAASAAGLSLEKRFQDLELNLPNVVRSNPFLKNLPSLQLTQTMMRNTQNSDVFSRDLTAAVMETGSQWAAELSKTPVPVTPDVPASPTETVGIPPVAPGTELQVPGGTPTPTPVDGTVATPPPTGEADIAQSDAILLNAQRLADKGEFKEALQQSSRIPNGDPYHAQAQEKIKLFSNRAVQDLRQRAAEAFSNARPMSDPKMKLSYLKQAKSLLEKALSDFPQADQLDTVRENLAVINHDLAAAEKTGS